MMGGIGPLYPSGGKQNPYSNSHFNENLYASTESWNTDLVFNALDISRYQYNSFNIAIILGIDTSFGAPAIGDSVALTAELYDGNDYLLYDNDDTWLTYQAPGFWLTHQTNFAWNLIPADGSLFTSDTTTFFLISVNGFFSDKPVAFTNYGCRVVYSGMGALTPVFSCAISIGATVACKA